METLTVTHHFSVMEKLGEPQGRKLLQLTRLLLERFNILFIPKLVK